jgi:hypothetical protein
MYDDRYPVLTDHSYTVQLPPQNGTSGGCSQERAWGCYRTAICHNFSQRRLKEFWLIQAQGQDESLKQKPTPFQR